MKKLLLILVSWLTVLTLGWCSSQPKQISVLDCWDNRCVANTIDSIQDTFVKNCVNENISLNTWLNNKILSWEFIWANELVNIDKLVRECVWYKVQNPNVSSTHVPTFPSFWSSFWWSFLWSYLANSFLWWPRYNYNYIIRSEDYRTYREDCNRRWTCWRSWGFVPYSAKTIWQTYSRSSFQSTTKWTLGTAWRSWSSTSSSSLW